MTDESESNYILSSDGLKLYYIISNVENPRAVVCILHGHGEHIGRYEHVMKHLQGQKIASVAVDFRGHGRSEGKRGHMPSMDQMLGDVEESLKFVRLSYLDVSMFLFGHSFGGCVVLNYVLKKPVIELSGFIASSPWLGLAFDPPRWKVRLGKFMASIFPRLSLTSELNPNHLSKDKLVIEKYISDPLVHNRISARFFQETVNAGMYVSGNSTNIKLPGLVYHGNKDQIISFKATKESVEKSAQIEFHELDGVFHEPHNDEEKGEVLNLISSWITNNLN